MSTQVAIDKLTKPELLEYTNKLVGSFNELTNNYSVLYGEYQRLMAAPLEAGEPVKNEEFLALEEKVPKLEQELEKLFADYTAQLKVVGILTTERDALINEKNAFINEINTLKEDITNLKLEKTSNPTLKTINTLNTLEKNTSTGGGIQIFEIKAHENRVDNTEFYHGREFTIAKIIVKLQDKTFSWTVDFLGSELFAPENFQRTVTMTDDQEQYFKGLLRNNTLYKSIKAMLDIPDKFDPSIWYNSILYKFGEAVKVEPSKTTTK